MKIITIICMAAFITACAKEHIGPPKTEALCWRVFHKETRQNVNAPPPGDTITYWLYVERDTFIPPNTTTIYWKVINVVREVYDTMLIIPPQTYKPLYCF